MTLTLVDPATRPSRAYETVYSALILVDGERSLEEEFPTQAERRDAVIEWLLHHSDEIDREDVDEALAPFGGANADVALDQVLELYADAGEDDFDLYLSEAKRDVGPQTLYSTLTDYGDGSLYVEHHPTPEARLVQLRQRALTLDSRHPEDFFLTADEATCQKVIETALMSSGKARVYLFEADRAAEGETYTSFAPANR